jgi:cytochrome c oxidase cbb3-type subunit III
MSRHVRALIAGAALTLSVSAGASAQPSGQPAPNPDAAGQVSKAPKHGLSANPGDSNLLNEVSPTAGNLLDTPQVHITPGAVKLPVIKNPVGNDAGAADRGMRYFVGFNCVGCHAPNGGGGMGISLSNSFFKYGADPANIYLVIAHGAPLGMPAWGSVLPDSVIWDLVAYIQSISKAPSGAWGRTTSAAAHRPSVEQVPAEFQETATPWQNVQPFSHGQKPTEHAPTSPGTPPTEEGPQQQAGK